MTEIQEGKWTTLGEVFGMNLMKFTSGLTPEKRLLSTILYDNPVSYRDSDLYIESAGIENEFAYFPLGESYDKNRKIKNHCELQLIAVNIPETEIFERKDQVVYPHQAFIRSPQGVFFSKPYFEMFYGEGFALYNSWVPIDGDKPGRLYVPSNSRMISPLEFKLQKFPVGHFLRDTERNKA